MKPKNRWTNALIAGIFLICASSYEILAQTPRPTAATGVLVQPANVNITPGGVTPTYGFPPKKVKLHETLDLGVAAFDFRFISVVDPRSDGYTYLEGGCLDHQLQIEIRKSTEAFTGAPNLTSDMSPVCRPFSGGCIRDLITKNLPHFVADRSYYWQARIMTGARGADCTYSGGWQCTCQSAVRYDYGSWVVPGPSRMHFKFDPLWTYYDRAEGDSTV